MKAVKLALMATGVIALGSSLFVSSTFAGQKSSAKLKVIRHGSNEKEMITRKTDFGRVQTAEASARADQRIVLVPPPSELPEVASAKMVTSIKGHAPASTVKPAKKLQISQSSQPVITNKPKQVQKQAKAQKVKPEQLFSYVRLLNYAPHPLNEDFLKNNPLSLNGKHYWLRVKYDEDWKVINDDEGYIKALGFEINIMENNKAVRNLKTPKVKIDSKTIKKGMILGIAEVAPYRFKISVDEFTKSRKGVSELVFKLDLMG
jgi:hypothetical protein